MHENIGPGESNSLENWAGREQFSRALGRAQFSRELAGEVYGKYQSSLKENNAVDFDDLLILPLEIFSKYPEVLKKYQNKWKYILK